LWRVVLVAFVCRDTRCTGGAGSPEGVFATRCPNSNRDHWNRVARRRSVGSVSTKVTETGDFVLRTTRRSWRTEAPRPGQCWTRLDQELVGCGPGRALNVARKRSVRLFHESAPAATDRPLEPLSILAVLFRQAPACRGQSHVDQYYATSPELAGIVCVGDPFGRSPRLRNSWKVRRSRTADCTRARCKGLVSPAALSMTEDVLFAYTEARSSDPTWAWR